MKINTIGKKIRFIGILFIILMGMIVLTSIYLNNKNKKDALVINIAGKERMLTQRISKNVFYLYHNNQYSFSELDNATIEFIYNLNSLKDGNPLIGIKKAPTDEIKKQISKVQILWSAFFTNINEFKILLLNKNKDNSKNLKNIVDSIYHTNNTILEEVDKLVSLFTVYSENKTDYFRYVQYLFLLIIIFLLIYSFSQLKQMEKNANKFLQYSRDMADNNPNETLKPIKIDGEKEIQEAANTINCFIDKVNTAVDYSTNASKKLEEITYEFDDILDELNSSDVSKQLDKSEDMVIQSQEELINSTKKLQDLKKELDLLLISYKNSK